MSRILVLAVISITCNIAASATHHYELNLNEDDPSVHSREIYFSDFSPIDDYKIYKSLIRPRRQVGGGYVVYPGGEIRRVGFGGPIWGSMSQTANRHGFTSPITYSGGAKTFSNSGHGISGIVKMQPGIGGQASIHGQVGLFNAPNHQLSGWAQHSRNLDKNFKAIGAERNSGGLVYTNLNNGASVSVSGNHQPGVSDKGSVSGSIPLLTGNGGRTVLEGMAQTNFGQGMKPQHQVGLNLKHNF